MVDYSRWDHIEVSDDEDDTHPNIDTPSLFRWRHQARVEKMQKIEQKEKILQQEKEQHRAKFSNVEKKMKKLAEEGKSDTELESLKNSLKELESEEEKLKKKEQEFKKEKKSQAWNVDTLSKPGFEKTVINKPKQKDTTPLSEEEQLNRSKKFMDENKESIKKYGMLHEYHDSEDFLMRNSHLACEDTANYLVVWCIDLEVEEKHALMERVAHQTICMQYLLELAKSLDIDARSTIRPFFAKMRKADVEYMSGFDLELKAFIGRVKGRAEARIEKAMQEYEAEERKKRLGPGGLDPVEVFDTLPEKLQQCFETMDIQMLQDALTTMPDTEARYHLKRCIDSGLWVPDAKKAEQDAKEAESKESENQSEDTSNSDAPITKQSDASTASE